MRGESNAICAQRTLLEACVLALLNREDLYGYMLTQNMQSVANLSESTLYPVLRRLEKQGLLRVYDQQFQGRNRRITPSRPRAARNLRRTAQNGTNIKNGYPI